MYEIRFTPEALGDLELYRKFEQKQVIEGIKAQLRDQPTTETRNRKKLRPNKLAEWEQRIDKFRVFYDTDEAGRIVKIVAIGHKEHNQLFIHGEEYEL
jgi:mRNA-degrading endonuclease RelE of RelBE toxin-antitoxin system